MSKTGSVKWNKEVDRIVEQTATRISAAFDKMIAGLPEGAAPQMAIAFVVRELAARHPWFMRLFMEDADIRKTYLETVAVLTVAEDMARVMGEIARQRVKKKAKR